LDVYYHHHLKAKAMKTRIVLFIAVLLLSCSIANSKGITNAGSPSREGSINVFASPDLYNLAIKWANGYTGFNPKVKINVIKSADNNIAGTLNTDGGIGFITDESYATLNNQSIWNMVVGRDVIVPVMNAANPFFDEIYRRGITAEGLARILEKSEKQNWGMLAGNAQNIPDIPVHYYIMNDPSTISGVKNFLNTNQLYSISAKTSSGQEMVSAIQKDPNALGFCKLVQIMDLKNQDLAENIKLVPIDKNGNGKIDYMENIYDNLQTFTRGVWIGKYPKVLSGNIYSVSSVKPKDKTKLAFLNWVLTDGQKFLAENGYNDLVLNERQTQFAKISEPVIYTTPPAGETYALLKMVLAILLAFAAVVFTWDILARLIRNKKGAIPVATSGLLTVFDENSVVIPKGLYFDRTHTWSFMKKDGTVKIGIDDFLQHITGPITRIEMKSSGEKIKKGDRLLTIIQKGKQLNIYAPISGTIKTKNESLITNSSLLNTAPYEDGWVYTIEPTNWSLEIQFLTMAEKYKSWITDEFSRLKDFFATAAKTDSPEYALIALQDGGAVKDNVLADLGPEIWEDFQTKFIDNNQIVNFFKFLTC
jgi:glycine cleavage system H lipoate-binding protein/ABC-type phosphate transport system substrate-binding protein